MNTYSSSKVKLCKTFEIFFVTSQILFGFNFGFAKAVPQNYRFFMKLVSALLSFLMVGLTIHPYFINKWYPYLFLWSTFEYCVYMFVLPISKYTLYDYLTDFVKIDVSLNVPRKEQQMIVLKTAICTVATLISKLSISASYCVYAATSKFCIVPLFNHLVYNLPFIGLDLPYMVQYLIVFTLYKRIHIVKTNLMSNNGMILDKTLRSYKEILDSMDNIKRTFDNLMMIGLCINVPKFMCVVYMSLHSLKITKDWIAFVMQYFFAIHMSLLTCLPAVVAEMVRSDTDAMKLALHNRLIEETVKEKRKEIKDLLRYMVGRPSEYKVWRIVPVDLRLPICLFSFCTTYLIVIIQFTHLYD